MNSYHKDSTVLVTNSRSPNFEWHCMCRDYPLVASIDGRAIVANSAEHLYQALKFDSIADQDIILNAHNAFNSKIVAKGLAGYHDKRPDLMKVVLRLKLEQYASVLFPRLDAIYSSNKHIVEFSTKDSYWGAKPEGAYYVGDNMLGEVWRSVYNEYKQALQAGEVL